MTQHDRPENSPAGVVPVLYRDAMMLVVDKPAGLPVHRGPAAQRRIIPVLTDQLDALQFGLPRKPEAVHRLDKDTSGCLVLGRHPRATAELNQLFRDGRIEKLYWAVVEGGPAQDEGLIDIALGKLSPERGWWMQPDPNGLPSQTRFTVLGRGGSAQAPLTWLGLEPLTGRTHQLRVHCAASGWPILGDPIYGTAPRNDGPGLHLHARRVGIPLYRKREAVVVEAPAPDAMDKALRACGKAGQTLNGS